MKKILSFTIEFSDLIFAFCLKIYLFFLLLFFLLFFLFTIFYPLFFFCIFHLDFALALLLPADPSRIGGTTFGATHGPAVSQHRFSQHISRHLQRWKNQAVCEEMSVLKIYVIPGTLSKMENQTVVYKFYQTIFVLRLCYKQAEKR